MSKEITKQEQSTESLISQAIEKGVSVETMEKLFNLRKEVKSEVAREAFVVAMADFQQKCPIIEKTKPVKGKDGTLRYKYAPIDSIVEQIKKPLSETGLAYTWSVKNETGFIEATAVVTHKLGHSESSSFKVPIDPDGYMTQPQKYASALTFAKRYSLCNALGISTGEEDTDATDVGKDKDAKSVKAKIVLRLRNLGEKTKTEGEVKEAVIRLTNNELVEKNYEEIASKLQVLIDEKNADKTIS